MIKPPHLQKGDTLGIVSPSWYGGPDFQHRIERGVRQLQDLGFQVAMAPHALNNLGYISDTPENRAADIHGLFLDPQVKGIIASIGGDHSCHLLPLLDFDLIRSHPKVFMGFSDITVLTNAIWKMTGLVTFNGPTVMTEFAEFPQMPEYSRDLFMRTVCAGQPVGQIEPSGWWTEEYLDWRTKADLTRARKPEASPGWMWLKEGQAEGFLAGGCIESLQHLRGTRYWPDFTGAFLFFETSEDAPTPADVDGILMDYENMGVFDRIHGLLFGRPMGYTPAERSELHRVVLERTSKYRFPIVADMDFGHTSPMMTLPIGCKARVDTRARMFEIIETAVT